MLHFLLFHYQNLYNTKSNMNKKTMFELSMNYLDVELIKTSHS